MTWITVNSLRRYILSIFLLLTTVYVIIYHEALRNIGTHVKLFNGIFKNEVEKNVLFPIALVEKYFVRTPGCTIPEYDPYDISTRNFTIKPNIKPIDCSGKPPLVYVQDHWININKLALKSYRIRKISKVTCKYRKFERITSDPVNYTINADFRYRKVGPWFPIRGPTLIPESEEFIFVRCIHNFNIKYENAYTFIPISKERVKEKLLRKSWSNFTTSHRPLSVLLIGVDSVSHLQYKRAFTKTDKFLKEKGTIGLDGYVKVGSNTYPNIIVLTTGYSEDQILKLCLPSYYYKFDDCPFIWKSFSERDYVTSFFEDALNVGTFHYQKTGFVEQPVDYYVQPYSLLTMNELPRRRFGCYGDQLSTVRVVNHANQMAQQFNDTIPYFGYYFTTYMTHDFLSDSYYEDEPYYNFIQKLFKDPKTLNNTILFFYSDHGIRHGDIRETFLGWVEACMPFFNVWLPPWFHKLYPDAIKNLKQNANRLTTPYDVHQTLVQVLNNNFNGEYNTTLPSGQEAFSLFDTVPEDRTCEKAGIQDHWCTCQDSKVVSITDEIVQKVVNFTVQQVNDYLLNYPICVKLELKEILSAMLVKPQKESTENSFLEYRVSFKCEPGSPLFEATVQISSKLNEYKLLGPISRINTFKGLSDCMDDLKLKNYCICEDVVK